MARALTDRRDAQTAAIAATWPGPPPFRKFPEATMRARGVAGHPGVDHDGHDVANLTSGGHPGGPVGRRVCLTCDRVLAPLVLCGQQTKRGRPCRVPVRADLGHTTCWSHGEGRGRASTPGRAWP
jgi:hypothetical protein